MIFRKVADSHSVAPDMIVSHRDTVILARHFSAGMEQEEKDESRRDG